MENPNKRKLINSVSAAVIATGLSFAAGLTGLVAVSPALAQVILSAGQIAAIQSSLSNALKAALDETAIEAAIANATQSAIALYGSASATSVTSIVMDTSEKTNIEQCVIGKGLAQAAISIATTNLTGANAVATTIANEGQDAERSCFQTAANEKGFSNLASIAGQSPTATGSTGSTGGVGQAGVGSFTGGGTVGGGGGCLNPSCTTL